VVALNLGQQDRPVVLDVAGRLPDGTQLDWPLDTGGTPVIVTDGTIRVTLPARSAAVLLTADGSDLTPPAAPGAIDAAASPGRVGLSWKPVEGATGYQVLRSLVSGGGYAPVATTVDTRFADTTTHNGAAAYYVVTALDAAGNMSGRSPESVARPQVSVTAVRLLDGSPLVATVSAVDAGTLVPVAVEYAPSTPDDAEAGLIVQVGLGPTGSDPTAPGWTWSAANTSDVAHVWDGSVRSEVAGDFDVAGRASADGGATWVTSATHLPITIRASADTEPPPAPGTPVLTDVGDDHVSIRWASVDAPDLYRYVVLRAPGGSTEIERIGATSKLLFTDTTVTTGASYDYAVAAEDTGFNRSPTSPVLSVDAKQRVVQVTFQVSVPADTPVADILYIAGDFQGWVPGQTPMTRVDGSTWAITIPFEDGTSIQYKYTRGTWDAVEKDDGCGEIPNRTLTADYGASQEQVVQDQVVKWRDVDGCG
jgi:hypothetical protein